MPYFVILTGIGRNGKDTIMSRIVPSMLGCYHYQGNHLAVTEESKTDLNVTIASFHKKRLVFMNEPPEGKTIKTSIVKQLTGGAEVQYRMPYSTNTKVDIRSTIFMACNDCPPLDNSGDAVAARLVVIPFVSRFLTRERCDRDGLVIGEDNVYLVNRKYESQEFVESVRVPLFDILVEKFHKLHQDGYMLVNTPDAVRKFTDKYLSDSDVFYSWFLSNYESVPESDIHVRSFVRLRELVEQYRIENQIRDSVTKLVDKLSTHRVLKKYLKDRHRFYDNGKQAEARNVLFGIRRVVDDVE